ncbi:hypothetical protein [Neisseria musculi]|uniref:hypothetical protein n=1 Tax=Neisseria musculi TaxID=1815583 RepID=UPI00164C1AF8|nr:hypothetical protein [Neisseria musculi]
MAIPAIGALYCALDKNCESVTETFIGMMAEQRRQAQEEHDAIFAAIQNTQKGEKKAQPKPQQGSRAATGAPMPPDDEDEKKATKHGEQRKAEAQYDSHRSVGDSNRVVREGQKYLDQKNRKLYLCKR